MAPCKLRLVFAFFLAPIVPCLIAALVVQHSSWQSGLGMGELMILVAWVFTAVFALPIYLGFQKGWYVTLRQSLVAGFAVGFLPAAAMPFLSWNHPGSYSADSGGIVMIDGRLTAHGWVSTMTGCLEVGALGIFIGAMFWVIAFREFRRFRAPLRKP